MLVKTEDIIDPSAAPDNTRVLKKKTGLHLAWVMSPPSRGSGGHQNILRFMTYAQKVGYKQTIILYSNQFHIDVAKIQGVVSDVESSLDVEIVWIEDVDDFDQFDAVFATGWETAYPVAKNFTGSKRFYFVQDFEPFFYAHGSEYTLAENTYKLGFYGITAGGWLSHKLSQDYGMKTDHFDFGVNKELYRFENRQERKKIFFYARPVTLRRGFELGVSALERFAKARPDVTIIMAGWDISEYELDFEYENLRVLGLDQLSDVYNQCAAALVLSHTNMSLLPLELLAAGTIPVVNDAPNNRMVSSNEYIEYTEASPQALADSLIKVIDRKDAPKYAEKAADSVKGANWDNSGEQFVKALKKGLHDE